MKVYKYRGIDNEILQRDISTLQKNQFFAPKFDMLNDPFELNFKEIISNTLDLIKSAFSVDTEKMKIQFQEIIELKNKIGIFSLSKTCYNDQMWAYYASSNKGYCIEYELDKLKDKTKNFDFSSQLEITYTNEIPTLCINDITENSIFKKMYGVKKESWKHEKEIRLVFDNSSLKNHHESSITGIYFGYQASDSLIESFKEIFRNRDVTFYKIIPNKQINILESKIVFKGLRPRKYQINKYDFEILKYENNTTVENYYIYLKNNLTNDELKEFTFAFREEYCYKPSNLNIFNSSEILSLIDKYPLNNEDYIRYADSYIALSDFSCENFIFEYPLKDLYYKDIKKKLE